MARLGEHYAKLTEQGWKHGERLERIEGKQAMQGGQLAELTGQVETLGRETRREHNELLTELPAAVATKVAELIRPLRERVARIDGRG